MNSAISLNLTLELSLIADGKLIQIVIVGEADKRLGINSIDGFQIGKNIKIRCSNRITNRILHIIHDPLG
jgi:hypothetical protein